MGVNSVKRDGAPLDTGKKASQHPAGIGAAQDGKEEKTSERSQPYFYLCESVELAPMSVATVYIRVFGPPSYTLPLYFRPFESFEDKYGVEAHEQEFFTPEYTTGVPRFIIKLRNTLNTSTHIPAGTHIGGASEYYNDGKMWSNTVTDGGTQDSETEEKSSFRSYFYTREEIVIPPETRRTVMVGVAGPILYSLPIQFKPSYELFDEHGIMANVETFYAPAMVLNGSHVFFVSLYNALSSRVTVRAGACIGTCVEIAGGDNDSIYNIQLGYNPSEWRQDCGIVAYAEPSMRVFAPFPGWLSHPLRILRWMRENRFTAEEWKYYKTQTSPEGYWEPWCNGDIRLTGLVPVHVWGHINDEAAIDPGVKCEHTGWSSGPCALSWRYLYSGWKYLPDKIDTHDIVPPTLPPQPLAAPPHFDQYFESAGIRPLSYFEPFPVEKRGDEAVFKRWCDRNRFTRAEVIFYTPFLGNRWRYRWYNDNTIWPVAAYPEDESLQEERSEQLNGLLEEMEDTDTEQYRAQRKAVSWAKSTRGSSARRREGEEYDDTYDYWETPLGPRTSTDSESEDPNA